MNKEKLLYVLFISVVLIFLQNVNRLELANLKQRIFNIREMTYAYKSLPTVFKGETDFILYEKPLVLCGKIKNETIVLELASDEMLYLYTRQSDSEKGLHLAKNPKKYFIKNGHLYVIEDLGDYLLLNNAIFFKDAQDVFLVAPDVMLSNMNCHASP
jgi:hypothetical protein